MSYRNNSSNYSSVQAMWCNFLPIPSYIFTINFNGTYKLGKNVHLATRNNEILVKTKTSISINFLAAMILNLYKTSENTLKLVYE